MNQEAPLSLSAAETVEAVREALRRGQRVELSPALEAYEELAGVLDELVELSGYAFAISRGDLGRPLAASGAMAGALKSLQASLRHLTWQTQRVAAGDFSQRVDFMGEFSEAFNSMVAALQRALADLAGRNEELQGLAARLEELAGTDALTGVCNRRRFDELAAVEVERARRYGQPFALVLLDVDHFKHVNDRHGHEVGDAVLVALAGLLRAWIRGADNLARWGGEEFVILAPGIDVGGAERFAERLRAGIAAQELGPVGRVTASFGVAQYRPGESLAELVTRADKALYRAKEGGRDRVDAAP